MNAVLCLAVFAVAVAVVTGENCQDKSDCSHVTCDAGHALTCHHSNSILGGGQGGQCTCSTDDTCADKDECHGTCTRFSWHCVDGNCHCGFGIGGIGK